MYTQTHTHALYISVAELNLYLEKDVCCPAFKFFLSLFITKKINMLLEINLIMNVFMSCVLFS